VGIKHRVETVIEEKLLPIPVIEHEFLGGSAHSLASESTKNFSSRR
jgi:hypothetical protein